eukprot:scaffold80256_cov42-Phaeocystis_antarctica.AAC.2
MCDQAVVPARRARRHSTYGYRLELINRLAAPITYGCRLPGAAGYQESWPASTRPVRRTVRASRVWTARTNHTPEPSRSSDPNLSTNLSPKPKPKPNPKPIPNPH